jgi:hypothetical protein
VWLFGLDSFDFQRILAFYSWCVSYRAGSIHPLRSRAASIHALRIEHGLIAIS